MGNESSKNHKLLNEYAKKLSCDGFELLMYRVWYENIDNIISDLVAMSLNIPVMHCDKQIGVKISRNEEGDLEDAIKRFEINCQLASEIGAHMMVIMYLY